MQKKLSAFIAVAMFFSIIPVSFDRAAALDDSGTDEVIVEYVNGNNNEAVNGKVIIEGLCNTLDNENGYNGKIGKSANTTADGAICTYVPRLSEGLYRIYMHKNYTATGSVKYTVHHKYSGDYPDETGGLNWGLNYATIITDANGDKWYPMGEYYFTGAFGNDYIKFSTGGTGISYGYFDAVKFEKIEEKTVLLDEAQNENELGKVEVSGTEVANLTSNSYGIGGKHRILNLKTYTSPVSLIYYPKLVAGEYEVFANRPRVVNDSNADMTASVTHANGTSAVGYSIRSGGDVQLDENWVSLGTYEFSGIYGEDNVEIKTADGSLGQTKNARFDAVKFVKRDRYKLVKVWSGEKEIVNEGTVFRGTDSLILEFDLNLPSERFNNDTVKLISGKDTIPITCSVSGRYATINLKQSLNYNQLYTFNSDDAAYSVGTFTFTTGDESNDGGSAAVDISSSAIDNGFVGVTGTVKSSKNIGISGRKVYLYDSANVPVKITTSSNEGTYAFACELPQPDNYGAYSFTVNTEYGQSGRAFDVQHVNIPLQDQIRAAFNSSDTFDKMVAFFNHYGAAIDTYIDALDIIYPQAIYKKLVNKKADTYEEMCEIIHDTIQMEESSPTLRMFDGEKEITELKSGILSARVSTDLIEPGCTIAVAVYSIEGKLLALGLKDYTERSDGIVINLGNVTVDAGSIVKLLVFDNISTLRPIDIYNNVYNLYVSPTGDDNGSGSADSPFLTLSRAKEAVAEYNTGMTKDIVVNIETGYYELGGTETFSELHSGKNGHKVIFKGVGEKPVISGGKKITGWVDIGGKWAAHVENIADLRQLYVNGVRAQRARNTGTYAVATLYKDAASSYGSDGVAIATVPSGSYSDKGDMELVFNIEWRNIRVPVKDVAINGGYTTFILEQPAWDLSQQVNYAPSAPGVGSNFYIENASEFLDEEGEFYFNKSDKMLYYIPRSGESIETADIYAGQVETLFSIEGNTVSNKAENMVFENLAFKYGTYLSVNEAGFIGGQATAFSNSNGRSLTLPGQFTVNKADKIVIKNCEFLNLGSTAVTMKNAVTDSAVKSCRFYDISGSAVMLGSAEHENTMPDGMERCTHNLVYNNNIEKIGNEYFQCPAITAFYVANTKISHNQIKNTPYTGISLGWGWGKDVYGCRDNEITYNRIDEVMTVLKDGGHIYTLSSIRNTIISNNYLTGYNRSYGALYSDQGSMYITWANNVVDIGSSTSAKWAHLNMTQKMNFVNNYVSTSNYSMSSKSNTVIADGGDVLAANGQWPQKALAIMEQAGITD